MLTLQKGLWYVFDSTFPILRKTYFLVVFIGIGLTIVTMKLTLVTSKVSHMSFLCAEVEKWNLTRYAVRPNVSFNYLT